MIPKINAVISTININELVPHPLSEKIYQVADIQALKNSIASDGLIEPLLIDGQNRILSGRRRWLACKALGRTDIQVKITDDLAEPQVEQLIIGSNLQRIKSKTEILNELEHILGILGKNQGQRRDLLGKDDNPETFGKIGKDRYEIASEWIANGMSAATLRRLMFVKEFETEYPDAKLGLVEKVLNNEMPINRAKVLAKDYIARVKEKEDIPSIPFVPAPEITSDNYTIHTKSSLDMSGEIADNSIQMVMTSVPYYDVRKYGIGKKPELGLEKTYQEYMANMVRHLKEIYRVLKPTGSFFLNIGDTYSKKSNYLISSRLVIAACDLAGFHCISEIIWNKTNTIPKTTDRKLQPSYEKIYHLVKDADKYYYKPFKIRDDNKEIKLNKITHRNKRGGYDKGKFALSKPYKKFTDFINQQEYEDIIKGSSAAAESARLHQLDPSVDHPAIFTTTISVLPILTTTEPGDLVLDPFSGSGSVGETCLLLDRKYIGYEIEERFSALSVKRLQAVEQSIKPDEIQHIQSMVKTAQIMDITGFAKVDEKAA